MPEIDLEPHNVREQDHKTGEWRVRLSKRWSRNWAFVGIVMLAIVFWFRGQIEPSTLFGITTILSLATGAMLQAWLKDVY